MYAKALLVDTQYVGTNEVCARPCANFEEFQGGETEVPVLTVWQSILSRGNSMSREVGLEA